MYKANVPLWRDRYKWDSSFYRSGKGNSFIQGLVIEDGRNQRPSNYYVYRGKIPVLTQEDTKCFISYRNWSPRYRARMKGFEIAEANAWAKLERAKEKNSNQQPPRKFIHITTTENYEPDQGSEVTLSEMPVKRRVSLIR